MRIPIVLILILVLGFFAGGIAGLIVAARAAIARSEAKRQRMWW